MTTYIAEFRAVHKLIQVIQHSVFTWQQEGGEIDSDLLKGKIKRESSMHFYKLQIFPWKSPKRNLLTAKILTN